MTKVRSQRLGVVGAGIMGTGIAQVALRAGFEVMLVDVSQSALDRCLTTLKGAFGKDHSGGEADPEEVVRVMRRVKVAESIEEEAASLDYVIEAVDEDLTRKREVFAELDAACGPSVVLASNTSQIPISHIADAVLWPQRVVGTHWFSPADKIDLVEVVWGQHTSESAKAATREILAEMGRRIVVCKRDAPGFVTTRLINCLIVEAARILEEGVADSADIDMACVMAFNHAMGPLHTADLGGLDTVLSAAEGLEAAYGDRFKAPEILRKHVSEGRLGRKTGEGFFVYDRRR